MCNCRKTFTTYEHQKKLVLQHIEVEKKDAYIYIYENKCFGYVFDFTHIPKFATLYETIKYENESESE